MSFEKRTTTAQKLIDTLQEHVFVPLGSRLKVVPFGYETHITDEIRQMLRFNRTETARHIKFAPDFFAVDADCPENLYLLEFKATLTPLYSPGRIRSIQHNAGDQTLDRNCIGQMEELAWENYDAMKNLNVRVAVLNYCAYCDHPLLCDYVQNFKVVYRDVIRTRIGQGSGTPWINFDVRSVRGLACFICDEHGLDSGTVNKLVQKAEKVLRNTLPVQKHPRSP